MPFYSLEGVIPVVDPRAFVHPTAVLIGDVIVGPGCYVGPLASLRGDFGRIVMEEGSNLQDGCVVHGIVNGSTRIGVNGHIGHCAVLHGCIVEHDALIGMNAVVMDEAVIGERAIVGPCAFVRAGFQVPAQTLALGIPAKVVRPLNDEDLAGKLEATRAYQDLTRRCLASLKEAKPLTALDADRPALKAPNVRTLTGSKRGS
jgi:phenylacetic acid degradation protein